MADQAELIRQFCDVTGTTEERSRFFLDSSNWQLEVALSSFFEHGGNAAEPATLASAASAAPALQHAAHSSEDSPPPSPLRPRKDKNKREKNRSNEGQKFATLSSLAQSDSSDEEEGQAFYAGGSERSGQQILGPSKNRTDFVAEMFKSVHERGVVAGEDDEPTGRQSAAFSGTGYRLGATADDHAPVPAAQPRSEQEARSVRLQLYREGFTVDSGSLRHYTDPNNAAFLEYIRRGEIPPELAAASGEVRVSLEDRRHEVCPASTGGAGRTVAFSGKGHMLGSPTPPTVGGTAPVSCDASDREANERAAQAALHLDDSQPITTIQIRLADGGRLIARFNHTHSVQNIREYITTAVPAYQLRSFMLMTTFPNAELKEPSLTLAEANLLNSVVVQRLQ